MLLDDRPEGGGGGVALVFQVCVRYYLAILPFCTLEEYFKGMAFAVIRNLNFILVLLTNL